MASLTADQLRRTPAYTFTEAAHYLLLPVTTLHAWCAGQDYRSKLVGTRVPTAILADRFKAGDALQDLADDYRTTPQAIEEALRCELDRREAA